MYKDCTWIEKDKLTAENEELEKRVEKQLAVMLRFERDLYYKAEGKWRLAKFIAASLFFTGWYIAIYAVYKAPLAWLIVGVAGSSFLAVLLYGRVVVYDSP